MVLVLQWFTWRARDRREIMGVKILERDMVGGVGWQWHRLVVCCGGGGRGFFLRGYG